MKKIKNTIPTEENKKAELFGQIREAHWKRAICLGEIREFASIDSLEEILTFSCENEEEAKRIEEEYFEERGGEKIIDDIFENFSDIEEKEFIEDIEDKIKEIAKKCENELREKGRGDDSKMSEKEEEELLKEVFEKFDENMYISAGHDIGEHTNDKGAEITAIYSMGLNLKKIVENYFEDAMEAQGNYLDSQREEAECREWRECEREDEEE